MSKKTSEVEEIKQELLDLVDEYFPKIKPDGVNKGRGEAAVIVGTAMARLLSWHTKQLAKEKMELVERIERLRTYPGGGLRLNTYKEGYKSGHDEALDNVLSSLKSEIQEKEEVGG